MSVFVGPALSELPDEGFSPHAHDGCSDEVRFEMSTVARTNLKPSIHWLDDEPMSFGSRYWTTRCEGFRVDFPGGAQGYVDEVRHPEDPDHCALVVRVGALGDRVVIVPLDEIELVEASAERIWLKSPVRLERSERAHR
jgi:hypothetical protein